MVTLNNGINAVTIRAYADTAVGYVKAGHAVPLWWLPGVMHPDRALGNSIRAVRTVPSDGNFDRVVGHVARVVGFVAAARSLDETIPLPARRAVVEADHAVLTKLTGSSEGCMIGPFWRGVEFTLDQWIGRHDTAAMPKAWVQNAALTYVLHSVGATRDAGGKPVVVFDLNGCLFRSGKRQATILAASESEHLVTYSEPPPQRGFLLGLREAPDTIGYDLPFILASHGVENRNGFLDTLQREWGSRFFTNLCRLDPAAPGGPEFVRAVMEAGGIVVYYTGRHETSHTRPELVEGMKQGTLEAMARERYPLPDDDRVFLVMKHLWEDDDFAFKQGALGRIDALGTVVAAFDNEPKALAMFYERWGSWEVDGFATICRVGRSRLPNPRVVRGSDFEHAPRLQDLHPLHSDFIDIADFRL